MDLQTHDADHTGPMKSAQGELSAEASLEEVAFERLGRARSMFSLALLCIASEVKSGVS